MSERDDAIKLAHRLLDDASADPDDDLRMLARQLLRYREVVEKQEQALKNIDWEGRATQDLVHANRDHILQMHEEAMRRVRRALESNKPGRRDLALEVLDALGQFHPMHGESWKGWPPASERSNFPEGQ